MLQRYRRQPKVLALSNAEAEMYCMVACSAKVLGILACTIDMGLKSVGTIYANASSAMGLVHRRVIWKVRRIRTQKLWQQEAHAQKRLRLEQINESRVQSEIVTKHLKDTLQHRHPDDKSTKAEGGRGELASALNYLGDEGLVIHDSCSIGVIHGEHGLKRILKPSPPLDSERR